MSWKILGHEWVVQHLKKQIVDHRLRHAYLFTGPQGIGRRTLAIRFIQAINCQNLIAPGEPCLECRTCEQIEQMQHPDLFVIQSERKGSILRVDQIRDVQRDLSLAPYSSGHRIAIFLRFEEANPSAANALLKTLEEPAPRGILILTAENEELLLPTIVSRCEVIRLRLVNVDKVSRGLREQFGLAGEQPELLARISGGRPGYALELHRNPQLLSERNTWLANHSNLLHSNRVERFVFADRLGNSRDSLQFILNIWLSMWRDAMLLGSGSSVPITNHDRLSDIELLAEKLNLEQIRCMIDNLERTLELIERNINHRLALEVLMLDLPVLE